MPASGPHHPFRLQEGVTVARVIAFDHTLDHRHLNDIIEDRNPSAENMAMWIYDQWTERYPELSAVRVSETDKTWAEYRP
ncbi:hypothetical protein SBADM41S_05942 [Streptomyces badius]